MLPLRNVRRWQIAGIVILTLVFALALMPAIWIWPEERRLLAWFDDADKVVHAVTFFLLTAWFAGQYRPRSFWRIGIGLIAFGALIELCQGLVSHRSAEWFDLVADTLGIVVGLLIANAGLGGWSLRFEQWRAGRVTGSKLG